ncbi:MAG: hypothetical protein FWC68_00875 [Oscillospiraceae bacterium]|nr:hypothetical protein [Oscillospiraceae bacterium]
MNAIETIEFVLRMFAMNICVYLLFFKIVDYKEKNVIAMIIAPLVLALMHLLLQYLEIEFIARLGITGLVYSIILGVITKKLISYAVIVIIFSYAIAFATQLFTGIVLYTLIRAILNEANETLFVYLSDVFTIFTICMILKMKRFSNGFSFLNNINSSKLDILSITLFILSMQMMLYYMIVRKPLEEITDADIYSFFIITSIFMSMLIFMCFRAYYKSLQTQKLISNLEHDVIEKDEKFDRLYDEHERITKKMHEISHQVQSFAYSMNTEFGEDNGDISQQIKKLQETLSKNATGGKNELPKTNIDSIDMMFCYMRSEALRKDIDLELKISDDVTYMVDNIIDKQDLEIMIADHIKDAIIAINVKNYERNRKILVELGKFNEQYELSISDTGIEFETDVLVNLGLKRVTTHEDLGGSGIGFMTTFEALQKYNASLVITEFMEDRSNTYAKTISFVFDNKNEYRIDSFRAEEIKKTDKENRIIVRNM